MDLQIGEDYLNYDVDFDRVRKALEDLAPSMVVGASLTDGASELTAYRLRDGRLRLTVRPGGGEAQTSNPVGLDEAVEVFAGFFRGEEGYRDGLTWRRV
jgi:hypothetical protein